MARKPGSRPRGYVTVTPSKSISPVRPPVGVYPGMRFTMTQLADAGRIYQRATTTGGGQSKGQGTIPVTLNATVPGSVYARCRAGDGTILQPSWIAANIATTGSQTVQIAGVDARLGWFFLDLSADGVTWQQGTTPVAMGRVVFVSGQSLATRMFTARDSQATVTIASVGVTPNPNAAIFASPLEPGQAYPGLPAWGPIAEGTTGYNSAFAPEFLNRQIAASGVSCALVGYARGATAIASFAPGGADNANLRATLNAVGGFEAFIWMQGHSDAVAGTSSATYQAALTSLVADVTARNTVRGPSFDKLLGSIPNLSSTSWGSSIQVMTIRAAQVAWAAANGAQVINVNDIDLYDNVHQSQLGSVSLARHFYRASRPGLGLARGDNGPTIDSAVRAAGSANIALSTTFPNGGTFVAVGNPALRFSVYASGTLTSPLALDNTTPITISGSTITLKLAAVPSDGQALDVYAFLTPDTAQGQTNAIYDNVLDGDGLTNGRQLMATLSAVRAAAPVPSQVGPNLTPTSVTYATSQSGFGQARSGGYGAALAADGSDVLPTSNTWTIEFRFQIASAPASAKVMGGGGAKCWIGVAADGRIVGNFAAAGGDTYFNGTTASGGGTNPVVTDGAWHHVALVADGANGVRLYLDGAQIGASATAAKTGAGDKPYNVGSLNSSAGFAFTGLVDEAAVWTVAKYTAGFTVPTVPYTGAETNLAALYHVDGNMNAAMRP